MRTRVRPIRPLLTAVTATALSAALLATGLPAHAATDVTGAPAPVAVSGMPAPAPTAASADSAPADAAPAAAPVTEPTASPTTAPAPPSAPAPAAAEPAREAAALPGPVLLTPAEGDAQVEGTTTFSGTGVAGATIRISVFAAGLRGGGSDAADFLNYSAAVGADGRWSTTETLPVGYWAYKADQELGEELTASEGNVAFTITPASPRITTPTPDARVEGRLRLAGTGAAGSRTVLTIAGGDEPTTVTTPVRADGTWSTEVRVAAGSYAVTAVASHPLPYERDARSIESAPTAPVAVTVTRAADAVRPVLLSPREGDSQVEGETTFSGTGEPDTDLWVYVFPEGDRDYPSDAGESLVFSTRVGADGRWSTTERLPIGIWFMKAEQAAGAAEARPTFTVAPAAPVITSPTADAQVSGRVHLTGTGTAGSRVLVTVAGSGSPRQLTADVRADGRWSIDAGLPSGRYSVTAVGSHLLPLERSERYIRSAASPAVAFSVTGGTAVAVSHRTGLPMTGADPVPLIALTGSLLAAGLALLIVPAVRRRRNALAR
ncbi:hypothetical protein [Clavibacter zhangzhiyongii]|uniref:Bacterial Ig-like domain-containing protein n=1 Tax=Clavibacter zhangzhiyongii TaxID=2768071 RepID=A0A7L7YYE7_9MICO|nr:hypothetical protein [Clavibacter zhangzhiyongii]QOD42492.1 hypothetical protein H9X71_07450 [Clavibacter zhangzhiyongii]